MMCFCYKGLVSAVWVYAVREQFWCHLQVLYDQHQNPVAGCLRAPGSVLSQPCWALRAQLQHSHVARAEGSAAGRCTAALLARTPLLCYCGVNVLTHSKGKKSIAPFSLRHHHCSLLKTTSNSPYHGHLFWEGEKYLWLSKVINSAFAIY